MNEGRQKMPYPWSSLGRYAGVLVLALGFCGVCLFCIGTALLLLALSVVYGSSAATGLAVGVIMMLGVGYILGAHFLAAVHIVRDERLRHKQTVEAARQEWLSAFGSDARTLLRSTDADEQTLLRPPTTQVQAELELLVRPAESAPE